jgi:hypothetical protein
MATVKDDLKLVGQHLEDFEYPVLRTAGSKS